MRITYIGQATVPRPAAPETEVRVLPSRRRPDGLIDLPRVAGPLLQLTTRRLQRALETGRIIPFLVTIIAAIAIVFAIVMRLVDQEDFPTLGVALWWSVQTVTTVGYGDVSPVEPVGRLFGAALMIVGFAFLSILTGVIASLLVRQRREDVDRIEARLDELERLLRERTQ
jgi:Ion channel